MAQVGAESEYKFGAGRYWQEPDVLRRSGAEIRYLGRRAYVIGGRTALAWAGEPLTTSLDRAGVSYVVEQYNGLTTVQKAAELGRRAQEEHCDVIVGVGGGRAIDLAKMAAAERELPVVTVPTSAATCAAFAPLSILYREDGTYDRCVWHGYEVSAVLVDTNVQALQPPRLLAAGILDAMAKCVEIANGRRELRLEDTPVSLHSAFAFAQYTYELLERCGNQAVRDLQAGQHTKCLDDVVFVNIALTGIISGITRGKGQTAVAHALYNAVRTWFAWEAQEFLHGEIVAVGLLAQLVYNGQEEEVSKLKHYMRSLRAPCSLAEIGIPATREALDTLYQDIRQRRFMVRDAEHEARLQEALASICGGKR